MKGTEYIEKLKEAYRENGLENEWNHLLDIANGISEEDKCALLDKYPEIPGSLMEILETIDGTYFREYQGEKVTFYFFGSDVDDGEYPYYLFSYKDIIENEESASYMGDLFDCFLEEPEYGLFVDERILMDADQLRWINFADCMNNGGTSTLYIDLTPSEKGKKGQIIRYLHDPDELKVIADSFDEFLDFLAGNGMKFIHPDDFE